MFDEPLPPGTDPEQFAKIVDAIEDRARKQGLYLHGSKVAPDQTGRHLLFMTFQTGKIAFSDRVLDPEKEQVTDEIRKMEADLVPDENAATRDELEDDLKDLEDED